jgi:hypothetical protein
MTNVHELGQINPASEEVLVSPAVAIPQHIANNILEFLRRVESKGMEAVAWVEAYQFMQRHVTQPQPGVPFGGLPQSPPKAK